MGRLAGACAHLGRARRRADRGDRHREARRAFRDGHARRDRRFSGRERRGPHHHARPRRVRHHRGRFRCGARRGAVRHLHRCRRRLHHRPAHRTKSSQAGAHQLRGDAGARLARREGAADALGRACDELRRQADGAIKFQRRSGHAGLPRGGNRGEERCERYRRRTRPGEGHAAEGCGPPRRRRFDLRVAGRWGSTWT